MTSDPYWRAIDQLREQCAHHKSELAVLAHDQELQRQQNDRLLTLMAEINGKIDLLSREVSQARGGILFGKWLAGIAVAAAGLGLAAWGYMRG